QHGRVVRRTLRAAVPREVVVVAIAVLFAVGFVVLPVITDQVLESEAIVRGDEVDAGVRPAAALLVEVARAAEAGGELRNRAAVALPEPADGVAVAAVPLRPADREVPHLV